MYGLYASQMELGSASFESAESGYFKAKLHVTGQGLATGIAEGPLAGVSAKELVDQTLETVEVSEAWRQCLGARGAGGGGRRGEEWEGSGGRAWW